MNTPQIDDGGPAFPQTETLMNSGFPDVRVREVTGGMTLRDWFACQASEKDVEEHKYVYPESPPMVTLTREQAKYAYADAMLKARNEQLPQNQ